MFFTKEFTPNSMSKTIFIDNRFLYIFLKSAKKSHLFGIEEIILLSNINEAKTSLQDLFFLLLAEVPSLFAGKLFGLLLYNKITNYSFTGSYSLTWLTNVSFNFVVNRIFLRFTPPLLLITLILYYFVFYKIVFDYFDSLKWNFHIFLIT